MSKRSLQWMGFAALILCGCTLPAGAQATVTLKIPRHSSYTLVQRLNREGVQAIEKHNYNKAAAFFYKAYLYDPADPFTLNNLAYIAEAQGQLETADKFYKLAAEQDCNAAISRSNVKRLQGQTLEAALAGNINAPMRVDQINLEAVRLLASNRGKQAVALLQHALAMAPGDPFTLNNLGVANEAIGDEESAIQDYTAAAVSRSHEQVIVTQDASWRGKPVSAMAEANAARLEKQLRKQDPRQIQSFELSLRGVSEENENDWAAARRDFMQAYQLDPTNAFALNNRGYVAEKDGDLESAEYFYRKAWQSGGAAVPVGLATDRAAQGKPLAQVADRSSQKVDGALAVYSQQRRESTAPVELTPRGNGAEGGSTAAPAPLPPPASQPQTQH